MPPRLTTPRLTTLRGAAPAAGRVGHPPAAPLELMSRTNRPGRPRLTSRTNRPGHPHLTSRTNRPGHPHPMSQTAQLQRGPAR
jgi:hypothetical protein